MSPFRTLSARSAVALSVLLALGACSSDDDDSTDPGDNGLVDPGGESGDALAVTLSTDQEVPPVTTAGDASGTAELTVDETNGAASGSIIVAGLTGQAQAAHIHRGFAGSNGPVLVPLEGNADGTVWSIPAGTVFDAETLGAYQRGELYFNVHTMANEGGELRGQIVPTATVATTFTVRIDNVSTAETLSSSQGAMPVPLSPGAWIVHRGDASPLLEPRNPASEALEQVAEDGNPENFPSDVPGSVPFTTGVDADGPGAIGPGGAFEFTFTAVPGDKLDLVTMFVQSNDWFYTFTDEDDSLSLFGDDGTPVSGVQTGLALWESGTEVDEEPGVGMNQVIRQSGPDTGEDQGGIVSSLAAAGIQEPVLDGDVIQVTVTPSAN